MKVFKTKIHNYNNTITCSIGCHAATSEGKWNYQYNWYLHLARGNSLSRTLLRCFQVWHCLNFIRPLNLFTRSSVDVNRRERNTTLITGGNVIFASLWSMLRKLLFKCLPPLLATSRLQWNPLCWLSFYL